MFCILFHFNFPAHRKKICSLVLKLKVFILQLQEHYWYYLALTICSRCTRYFFCVKKKGNPALFRLNKLRVCLARLQVLAMSKNYLSPITYDVLQKRNEWKIRNRELVGIIGNEGWKDGRKYSQQKLMLSRQSSKLIVSGELPFHM